MNFSDARPPPRISNDTIMPAIPHLSRAPARGKDLPAGPEKIPGSPCDAARGIARWRAHSCTPAARGSPASSVHVSARYAAPGSRHPPVTIITCRASSIHFFDPASAPAVRSLCPPKILGRRVIHHVRAKGERLLQDRRRERVIDHRHDLMFARHARRSARGRCTARSDSSVSRSAACACRRVM